MKWQSSRRLTPGCCPPQGRELLRMHGCAKIRVRWLLSPAGARVVTLMNGTDSTQTKLLSPAGARAVTGVGTTLSDTTFGCCPPQGRELLLYYAYNGKTSWGCCPPQGRELLRETVRSYVERRDRCCPPQGRELLRTARRMSCMVVRCCPPQGRELLLQTVSRTLTKGGVAVPRRGASCYGKNAKNTMRIFGIPTIFLYYLLYFCVSIRDIVGFLWCEPACNNLIYCYYNTRFAPNQPASKPSSFATGCKTQRHKL